MLQRRAHRYRTLSILSSLLYLLLFPFSVHLIAGGEFFGAFLVVPLSLIALGWGQRAGIAAAATGIAFSEAVMISEHFLIRHLASSPYWFALVAAPVLVYLFVGSLVGRLGDALRGREEAEAVLAELESRHSAVLANLAIGVAVSDTAETITFANPQAEMIFGTEKGTLVGRNLGEFVSDEELAHVRAETERRSRGETSSYEMGIRRASGETRRIQVTAAPQYDDTGKFVSALVTFQDITEHVQTRQRLDEETARLQTLIDNLPDAVYLKDTQSRFMLANPALADMMNAGTPQNLFGKTDHDFYSREEADGYLADERRIMAERSTLSNKPESSTVKGSLRWITTTKAPIIDRDGTVRGLVGISRDVTERMRVEEQLAHERALMQTLMDSSADYIWFKDREGRFILANKATAHHFDVADPPALVGKTDADFFSPSHAHTADEDERRIVDSGQPMIDVVERETWPDKPDRWVSTTKMPLRDAEGRIIGTFGISRDITDRRKMEERNLLLAAMVASSNDAIIGVDLDDMVTSWNRGAEKTFGYTAQEMVGKPVTALLFPEMIGQSAEQGGDGGTEKRVQVFESLVTRKDGSQAHIATSLSPVIDDTGRIVGMTAISRDQTQQRALQAQIIRSQRLESLATLAAGVAHQFNNANTVVKGYLDFLAGDEALSSFARSSVEEALKAVRRMVEITERLQAFTNAASPGAEHLRLEEELPTFLQAFEERFQSSGITARIDLQETQPVRVSRSTLGFIVTSLLTNSIHALITGSSPTVAVRTRRGEGFSLLEVSDNGCGIAKENLTRVFTPFFTTKGEWADPASPQSRVKGIGLSLAVCQSTVAESGGWIEVESAEGSGTTFRVWLPAGSAREG